MKKSFNEKYGPWAVVTGGTSGIGLELSKKIAKEGINLVLIARNLVTLKKTSEELSEKYNIEVRIVKADLSKTEDCVRLIEEVSDLEVGLFIPAAGIETHGSAIDMELKKELELIQVNITAVYALTHHFAGKMAERGKGGIIIISSIIGHMPNPYLSNYAGTKAYKYNFGTSLHWELKKKGVDVTVLCPGYTITPMTTDMKDLDMSKTPMTAMTPDIVAECGLKGLGKKAVVIPGFKNRMMVFMGKRLMSFSGGIAMGGKMMEKAMS